MEIGVTLIVIVALAAVIYIFIEIKRVKHKLFAIFLIALLVFGYAGYLTSLSDKDIDYASIEGLGEAASIYMGWLSSVGENLISVTSNVVKMDWSGRNETVDVFEGGFGETIIK